MLEEAKKTEILELGEVDTYFLIDECGGFIWHMTHEMSHGRIGQEHHEAINADILTVSELQQFAVNNLGRFGIDPESANDRENGDYWKWYHFWDGWKKGLSNEDWDAVNNALQNKTSYEKYLPKATWKD